MTVAADGRVVGPEVGANDEMGLFDVHPRLGFGVGGFGAGAVDEAVFEADAGGS